MAKGKHTTPSVWRQTSDLVTYPPLQGDLTVDVAVVGAGITGLTTALYLQQAGQRVAVIEAIQVGSGTSGFNSGHLTSELLDVGYVDVIRHFGKDNARRAAESQIWAIEEIERLSQLYRIVSGFQWVEGYLYAERPDQVAALEEEVAAMHTVGLAVDWAAPDSVPLPFLIQRAARLPRQARFHPLCYLQGLARQLVRGDNPVFEQTHVLGVDTSQGCTVQCEGGRVFADAVVLATHTPIGLWPVVQTKVEPMRSYIIGIRTETPLANALFWDMEEPYHYLRLAEDEQGPLMIVGGEDHKTGESAADPEAAFQRLEAYSRSRFGPIQVDYRWSAQLYDPADGLPYIGASHAEPSVYFATGYTGEGLTGGTYAARILADAILGQPNPWADLYDPNRVKPVAGAAGLWSENIGTLKHFVGDRIRQAEGASIEAVAPGEGMLVDENGQKVAVYREADGSVHRLSPVCTHAGCLVHWNPAEASWDCPCHGGRYDAKGKVLNGPPTRCLEALDAQGNPQGGVLTAGAHHENP